MLGLSEADLATTARAASLSKSDLATQMVVELTSLQGIMGREYARLSGERDAVATAIFEAYLPRSQGDSLPATAARPGAGAGEPAGFAGRPLRGGPGAHGTQRIRSGLRRDALGLVQALVGLAQPFDLRPAIRAAAELLPVPADEAVLADVLSFVRDRLYAWLRDQGLPHDAVNAALAEQAFDPYRAAAAARDLAELTQAPDWSDVFTAYARCKRIVRNLTETYALAPEHYTEPATREPVRGRGRPASRRISESANVATLGTCCATCRRRSTASSPMCW